MVIGGVKHDGLAGVVEEASQQKRRRIYPSIPMAVGST